MKRSFLAGIAAIVFIVMLSPFASHAQNMQRRSPQDRADKQTKMMQKKLSLSADQSSIVSEINYRYAMKIDSVSMMPHGGGGRKMERQNLMMAKDAELQNALTKDQFQRYQAMEEQMKEKMKARQMNRMQNAADGDMGNNQN